MPFRDYQPPIGGLDLRHWYQRYSFVWSFLVFALYGLCLYQASSDPAVGWFWIWAVVACIALGAFTIVPWSRLWYVVAGVAGFTLWAAQACRLAIALWAAIITDGTPGFNSTQDWRIASGVVAFTYFATIWWSLWLVPVKMLHEKLAAQRNDLRSGTLRGQAR